MPQKEKIDKRAPVWPIEPAITSFTSSRSESSPPLSGLLEWTTPTLTEIEYTEELRRLYRCEMMQEAAGARGGLPNFSVRAHGEMRVSLKAGRRN